MSASSSVIPAASVAAQAAAPKRGVATPDADFARVLDATPTQAGTGKPADVATKPAQPPLPSEDASETSTEPTPIETAATTIPPIPVAQPPVVVAAPLPEAALVGSPPPVDQELPVEPGTIDANADPAEPTPPHLNPSEQSRAPAAAAAAAPPTATAAAAQAATPAPASSPEPRAEEPSGEAQSESQVSVAPIALPQPKADPLRPRDAIDRAQASRSESAGPEAPTSDNPPADTDADAALGNGGRGASQGSASLPQSNPAVRPVADPVVAPIATPDVPVLAPAAHAVATEARPVETGVSLALSTLSHATIETTAQIAAQIVRKLEGRSTRFEMALTPDGLGQVDISMDIDNDGKLIARLAFDNPLAATEMRGRVDDLRRQLQEAGFTVADDALSFTDRDPSSQFFGQSGAFDRRPDPRGARAFGAASRLETDSLLAPARWIPLALTPDRVDMKV